MRLKAGVLGSVLAGFFVAILIVLVYLGMHLMQGDVRIVNVSDLFLGIGLMVCSLGFLGVLVRVRGTLGWVPLAIVVFTLIVLFLIGWFLVSSNIA